MDMLVHNTGLRQVDANQDKTGRAHMTLGNAEFMGYGATVSSFSLRTL